jgi:hypothetical protein
MAITTLVADLIAGVQSTLQDNAPAFRRWPEIELVRYINYGQRALAKYVPQCGTRTDAVRLAPGTRQDLTKVLAAHIRPGDGSTAADTYGIAFLAALRNMGSDGASPGRALRAPVDRYSLDAGTPDWHTAATATVVREIVVDKAAPLTFYVSPPIPTTPAVWLELRWMVEPARIAAGGAAGSEKYTANGSGAATLLSVDDLYAEDMHNYVVAAALLKGSKNTQNLMAASMHAQLWIASVNAQAAMFTGVSPNLQSLPFITQATGVAP